MQALRCWDSRLVRDVRGGRAREAWLPTFPHTMELVQCVRANLSNTSNRARISFVLDLLQSSQLGTERECNCSFHQWVFMRKIQVSTLSEKDQERDVQLEVLRLAP